MENKTNENNTTPSKLNSNKTTTSMRGNTARSKPQPDQNTIETDKTDTYNTYKIPLKYITAHSSCLVHALQFTMLCLSYFCRPMVCYKYTLYTYCFGTTVTVCIMSC